MNLCVPSRLCGERKREVNRRGAKSAESTVQRFNVRIRSGNSLPIPLEWSTGMERGGALLVSTGLLLELVSQVFGGVLCPGPYWHDLSHLWTVAGDASTGSGLSWRIGLRIGLIQCRSRVIRVPRGVIQVRSGSIQGRRGSIRSRSGAIRGRGGLIRFRRWVIQVRRSLITNRRGLIQSRSEAIGCDARVFGEWTFEGRVPSVGGA